MTTFGIRSTPQPVLAVFFAFLLLTISSFIALAEAETAGPLPAPVATGNSVELCLNSRVSEHGGWSGEAPEQWLSNVLWAAGKAPFTGSYRVIHVTTPNGKYLYDPGNHSLTYEAAGDSSPAAFILEYDRELDFDAGVSYMPALLAAVSLWNGTESQLANCPMGYKLYFGIKNVRGLTSELVAHSSNGSLPDPSTEGDNDLEDVLANLKYTNQFAQENLSLQQVSQILWAGYGGAPHITYNGRAGVTVPSAFASYYLTGRIYIAKQDGVFRYHNRNPSYDLTTRDHRIEQINDTDVKSNLQSVVPDLPQAPYYIILCIDSGLNAAETDGTRYARLETGFAAGNMLMQASAEGLGCYFTTKLTAQEQSDIRNVTGIPQSDVPQAIVSIGKPLKLVPTVISTDDEGNEKNVFFRGENVSVKASGLLPGTNYTIWIQPQFVGENDTLEASKDPSGTQENVTTDGNGNLSNTMIWQIPMSPKLTFNQYDIVIDKHGEGWGTYNAADDGLDAVNTYGIVEPIPEPSTLLLFGIGVATLLVLVFVYARLRKSKK